VIIRDYELIDKALQCMAKAINAADTDHLEADPLAAGFEAIRNGLKSQTTPLLVQVA